MWMKSVSYFLEDACEKERTYYNHINDIGTRELYTLTEVPRTLLFLLDFHFNSFGKIGTNFFFLGTLHEVMNGQEEEVSPTVLC